MPKASSPETIAKWETTIRKQQASGMSVNHWCREHQIVASVFHYWKGKLCLEPRLDKSHFTELSDPQKSEIVLECEGIRICLGRDFDSVTLKQCLILLQEVKC
jgi:hypothetical protein